MRRWCVDLTINDPHVLTVMNCIIARYDCGISNYQQTGGGVVELIEKERPQMEIIAVLGGEQKHQAVKKDGICTTLCSSMGTGGGYVPMLIAAMQGRDKTNPSHRGRANENYEQRLEPRRDGCAGTITTVQKDNLVVEKIVVAGQMEGKCESLNRVYDPKGLAPTISTCQGGSENQR